jgi:ribose transport system substrate-binding protein
MRRALWIPVLAILVSGCGGSAPAPAPAAAPAEGAAPAATSAPAETAAGDTVRVAFVTNNASDFWKIAEAGTKKAAAEFNVDVLFRIPSAGTAEQQQQIVQDLVTRGVSGIAISPKDPSNQTGMLNEAAAKVNLVTQDSDAPESNRLCYIGTNNYDAGREAGKLVKQCVPAGGKIMICVGTLDAQNARDRLKGLEDEIKDSGQVIAEVRTDETDRAKAVANVEDALLRHPDVVCFVGLWSYNGPAILNAVKSSGRAGDVKIVCFDEEEETLQGVKDGHIFGTVVQRPFEFGYESVKLLAALGRGDQSGVPAEKQVVIPTLSVTQANVDAFWSELKSMVGGA